MLLTRADPDVLHRDAHIAISRASRDSLFMALRSQLDFSLESILRT